MGVGSGFSQRRSRPSSELRHPRPALSPYIGVVWERKFGETADFAREEGEDCGSLVLRNRDESPVLGAAREYGDN